jgi:FkbM family methyltransferase
MISKSLYSTFSEPNSLIDFCNRISLQPKHLVEIGVGGPQCCRTADFINHGVRIQLFEANPIYYNMNVEVLGKCPGVEIYNVAIFNKKGKSKFLLRDASGFLEGTVSPYLVNGGDDFSTRFTEVETDTIDKYDDGTIDLLTVDIEGSEWFVLERLISRPKLIVLETHGGDFYLNPYIKEITKFMEKNNYSILWRDESDTYYNLT